MVREDDRQDTAPSPPRDPGGAAFSRWGYQVLYRGECTLLKVMRNRMNWYLGAEANSTDGQVLTETCLESHIYQDFKGFKSRSDFQLSD